MSAWVVEGGHVLDDEQHYVYEQVRNLADSSGVGEYDILLGWVETGHVTLDDAYRVAAVFGDADYFADMLDEAGA